ncbi:hypothetical protein EJ110_NYTH51139 [Nymphaea thermarum]|nr:hypothetical protein EJ110_NYTH51139 [Nymphaea thermarum]
MRKVFGQEPTRGELSKVVGSDISAMRSSLKRGWYSKHTLLSNLMGLIRSITSEHEHQGRGVAIEDLLQHLVADEDAETATEMFMRELLREEMTKLIGSISPKEAEVLRYRYGFQNDRTMTLRV